MQDIVDFNINDDRVAVADPEAARKKSRHKRSDTGSSLPLECVPESKKATRKVKFAVSDSSPSQ
jgi:hypothetical protein